MSEHRESELPLAGEPRLKLAVKDFGPIAEGEVELRPLTVFAGPSNTGKSWLATLIYAMARHADKDYDSFSNFGQRVSFEHLDSDSNGGKTFPENPAGWSRSLQKNKILRLTDGEKQVVKSVLESDQKAIKEELLRCFGLTEARHLVREGEAGAASVTFLNAAPPASFAPHRRLTVTRDGIFSIDVDVMKDEGRPLDIESVLAMLEYLLRADSVDDRSEIPYVRAELLNFLVHHPWYETTHYLPADRGGVMHAHRVVVGALIQSASRASLTHRSPLPTLSGVLGDFLEQLIDLAGRRPRHPSPEGPAAGPADSLEKKVLRGRIDIQTNDVDYPHFTFHPDGWDRKVSLMSVSSMVSELAPVALYLRHCVRKGDLLILEEPEAHLHPTMQVDLLGEIAGWVRQGINVLITTHSEWVLEEISNLVAAGEGEKENGIRKQDVGMWLFELNEKQTSGSQIREIEWSVDEGGFALDYDDVAMRLHNKWASLAGSIK